MPQYLLQCIVELAGQKRSKPHHSLSFPPFHYRGATKYQPGYQYSILECCNAQLVNKKRSKPHPLPSSPSRCFTVAAQLDHNNAAQLNVNQCSAPSHRAQHREGFRLPPLPQQPPGGLREEAQAGQDDERWHDRDPEHGPPLRAFRVSAEGGEAGEKGRQISRTEARN